MIREATELLLGRGEVYFDRFIPGTLAGHGERYIGNTTTFQISRTIQRTSVYRSYRGRKVEMPGFPISDEAEVQFTTDNIVMDNIADWYGGNVASLTVGDEFIFATQSIVAHRGRFYQLLAEGVEAIYVDIAEVRRLGTLLQLGVHYELERVRGRIQILPNAPAPFTDGSTLVVNFRKRPSSYNYVASQNRDILGALRYLAADDHHGPKVDYFFPMVRLSPQGAIDLKGDEFQQMRFTATGLIVQPGKEILYARKRGLPPKPITADTTLITADSTAYSADNGTFVE